MTHYFKEQLEKMQAGSYPDGNPPAAGLRYNAGKLRYDLIPPDALEVLAGIFTMGAKKYTARNWEKGFVWTECYASLMRHLQEWAKGEDFDDESGFPHMGHVMWNAMALTTFQLRKVGVDDRPSTRDD